MILTLVAGFVPPRRNVRMAAAGGLLAVLMTVGPASAQQSGTADNPPDFWHREKMTGDWDGLRTTLSGYGVAISMTYTADPQGNVAGGIKRGAVYDGLLQTQVDVDLGKM